MTIDSGNVKDIVDCSEKFWWGGRNKTQEWVSVRMSRVIRNNKNNENRAYFLGVLLQRD